MTDLEKQEIVNAVISSLSTNSTTINQLTETTTCNDNDYFENSRGNKVSYANIVKPIQEKFNEFNKSFESRFKIIKTTTEVNI